MLVRFSPLFSEDGPPTPVIALASGGTSVTAQTVYAGQAPSAAFPANVQNTSNWQSSAGSIVSAVRQVSIAGGAWTTTLTGALDPGQSIAVRVLVTDSAANVASFPSSSGDVTVALPLPVPSLFTAPIITGGAVVGGTPTVTAATWAAIPDTPAGMAREVEARLTVDGGVETAPLDSGTLGGLLRAEARARHTLNGKTSEWSDWFQSSGVTVGVGLSLTPTADGEREGAAVGDFTITITSPAPYIGGAFSIDQSNEGGALAFNETRFAVAPQGIIRPSISLTTDADLSGTATINDAFTAVRGLWIYDSADVATVSQTGRWQLDGVDIPGGTTLAQVAASAGALTYVETLSGAGVTRTMTSNTITVAAGGTIVITGRPDGIELTTSGSVTVTGRPDGILVE